MSEISVLSNQYDKLVTTSDQINNSVITLKKKSLTENQHQRGRYPNLQVSSEEVMIAQNLIAPFLKNLQRIIRGEPQEPEYIPAIILDDYKRRLSSNEYLEADLTNIISKMDNNQEIDDENFIVLDDILSVLDTERSTLFRKLRTARG